jgi:hypothetical protein
VIPRKPKDTVVASVVRSGGICVLAKVWNQEVAFVSVRLAEIWLQSP